MTNENQATEDPFAGCSPLPGLEHLGRAIVDAWGVPSGSPANFEALRGAGAPIDDDAANVVQDVQTLLAAHRAAMLAELAGPPPPEETA